MKNIVTYLFFILVFTGCGGSSDDTSVPTVPPVDVTDSPSLSIEKSFEVNSSNQSDFLIEGECKGVDKVVVSGSLSFEVICENEKWQKRIDVSFLPNGVHKITVTAKDQKIEFEVKKNTLDSEAVAFYSLSDAVDLGKDEGGNHNAQSIVDLNAINDATRGVVAEFNGSSSGVQLSDGNFFNDSFTQKSFSFFIKTSDLSTSQLLIDEGGSGNGMGVRIENDQVIAAVRSGGSSSLIEHSQTVSGLENQWVHIIATFNNGELSLIVNEHKTSDTASYSVIPRHGDSGGVGSIFGSSVFDGQAVNPYMGLMSSLKVFNRALSKDEVSLLAGTSPQAREFNSLELGRITHFIFENSTDLGSNSQENLPDAMVNNVAQGSDSEKGATLILNGTDSSFQISNGQFWNKAFEIKTYALYFKASDLMREQVLFEEGGRTNGIALRVENGYLFANARAGNSAPEQVLIEDIIDKNDEWVKVVVQFNKGEFSMSVNRGESLISRSTGFTTIPDHSSDGGLGRRYGGDSSGQSGNAQFNGEISKFSTYGRVLTKSEIDLF